MSRRRLPTRRHPFGSCEHVFLEGGYRGRDIGLLDQSLRQTRGIEERRINAFATERRHEMRGVTDECEARTMLPPMPDGKEPVNYQKPSWRPS
jgi:hypothetical protein